jgi:hypothetical protein
MRRRYDDVYRAINDPDVRSLREDTNPVLRTDIANQLNESISTISGRAANNQRLSVLVGGGESSKCPYEEPESFRFLDATDNGSHKGPSIDAQFPSVRFSRVLAGTEVARVRAIFDDYCPAQLVSPTY